MVARSVSLRDMRSDLHTIIRSHLGTIDEEWLQGVLVRSARACVDVAGWTSGSASSNSGEVETDKHEGRCRGHKGWRAAQDTPQVPCRLQTRSPDAAGGGRYYKHHTQHKEADPMLETTVGWGLDLGSSTHSCDEEYDWESNFTLVFGMGMMSNIKQRSLPKYWSALGQGAPYRRKGSSMLD